MTVIRTFSGTFNLPLKSKDVYRFRGAMGRLAGSDRSLYHMHLFGDGEDEKIIRGYPLIHYRMNVGMAAIFGINEGADQILLDYSEGVFEHFRMGRISHPLKFIEQPEIKEWNLEILEPEDFRLFRLYKGLLLNSENYHHYKALPGAIEKTVFLQQVLGKHLNGFARSIGWNWNRPEQWLSVVIVDIDRMSKIQFRGRALMAFDLVFKVNASLAPLIAIGKGVSHGYGWLLPLPKS